ncbi:MAG: hypothetical protein LBI17_00445 [Rickettsiales bacterium]|jgi:hypothetical protein|nr:hypothetical protein [Rickettsiales bacterium]
MSKNPAQYDKNKNEGKELSTDKMKAYILANIDKVNSVYLDQSKIPEEQAEECFERLQDGEYDTCDAALEYLFQSSGKDKEKLATTISEQLENRRIAHIIEKQPPEVLAQINDMADGKRPYVLNKELTDALGPNTPAKKVADVYNYSVKEKLQSGIPELDEFLGIIQPALNQLIIMAWRPGFWTWDKFQEFFVGTDKEESVASRYFKDRKLAKDDLEFEKKQGWVTDEEIKKARSLKKKNELIAKRFSERKGSEENPSLLDQLNALLDKKRTDIQGEIDVLEDSKDVQEYKKLKSKTEDLTLEEKDKLSEFIHKSQHVQDYIEKSETFDAGQKGGRYEPRKTLFDKNQPADETLEILDEYFKKQMAEMTENAPSYDDEHKKKEEFLTRMWDIFEKCNPKGAKPFINEYIDKFMGHWQAAFLDENASNRAEKQKSYIDQQKDEEAKRKYWDGMALSNNYNQKQAA